MNQSHARPWNELTDRDGPRSGITTSLVLISGACVLWWIASLIVGPLWLAIHRDEPGQFVIHFPHGAAYERG